MSHKTIESCQFKRTEDSPWEHGFNLDDGNVIIDLYGNEITESTLYDLERRSVEAPHGKSFVIKSVEGGFSLLMVDHIERPIDSKSFDSSDFFTIQDGLPGELPTIIPTSKRDLMASKQNEGLEKFSEEIAGLKVQTCDAYHGQEGQHIKVQISAYQGDILYVIADFIPEISEVLVYSSHTNTSPACLHSALMHVFRKFAVSADQARYFEYESGREISYQQLFSELKNDYPDENVANLSPATATHTAFVSTSDIAAIESFLDMKPVDYKSALKRIKSFNSCVQSGTQLNPYYLADVAEVWDFYKRAPKNLWNMRFINKGILTYDQLINNSLSYVEEHNN